MVDAGFSFQQYSFLTEFHYLHTFNLCFLNFLLYTDQIFYHDYLDLYTGF